MKRVLISVFLALIVVAALAATVTITAASSAQAAQMSAVTTIATQTFTANIMPAAIVTPMQATEMLAATQTFAAKQNTRPAADVDSGVVVVICPTVTAITATSTHTGNVGPQVTRLPIVLGSAIAAC